MKLGVNVLLEVFIDSINFFPFILGLCNGTFKWHDYAPSNGGTISEW